MKLYYAPGACSLADHIALVEAGVEPDLERVDLKTKTTASGRDFRAISAKGYVPALVLDGGEMITENIAVLDWIAERYPALGVQGPLGRTSQLEALAFIATELHAGFKPLWHGGSDGEKAHAKVNLEQKFAWTADALKGGFLFGDTLSVADCYLFVMLRWAEKFQVTVPENLARLRRRMERRRSVQLALEREELTPRRGAAAATVNENLEHRRFERVIEGDVIAAAYYRPEDGNLVFVHTEVPKEFGGKGIATELARGAFDLLRSSGRKAVLQCPFMLRFYTTHPEYADVVAG